MSVNDHLCSIRNLIRVNRNGLPFNNRSSGCFDFACLRTASLAGTIIINGILSNTVPILFGCSVLFVHIRAFQIIIFFQDSGCPDSFRNIYRSRNDSLVFICSFDGLSVSCIHHNMMDITVFCIEDQIPRLCIINRNLGSILALIFGYSWQIIAKSLINLLYKSGAVCPVCQACTAPYIRISNELCGKLQHCLADRIPRCSRLYRSIAIIKCLVIFRCDQFCSCLVSTFACCFYLRFYFIPSLNSLFRDKPTDIPGLHIDPVFLCIRKDITQITLGHGSDHT